MIHTFSSVPDAAINRPVAPDFRSDIDQHYSLLQQHDDQNPDHQTALSLAAEAIRISGALVDVHIRTNNEDYNKTFDEDPNPTYWNKVSLKAYWVPQPLEHELTKWGADTSQQAKFVFAILDLQNEFGTRLLRHGDVIEAPYNDPRFDLKYYIVTNATPQGNYRYNWLYMGCSCEVATADSTLLPESIATRIKDNVFNY